MKKRNFNQLALLGLASGLLTIFQSAEAYQAIQQEQMVAIDQLFAAHDCKGPNGCPGTGRLPNTKSAAGRTLSTEIAEKDKDEGNLGYHLYTEDELLLELNDNGVALYKSLSPEGKVLARKVASQRCDHTNDCKGLNACQTDKNECAGKGSCKGQGKCALSDKNLAVKIVGDKMAKKRAEANGQKNNS